MDQHIFGRTYADSKTDTLRHCDDIKIVKKSSHIDDIC